MAIVVLPAADQCVNNFMAGLELYRYQLRFYLINYYYLFSYSQLSFSIGFSCPLTENGITIKDEIKAFFSSAGNNNFSKSQVLYSLHFILEKYGFLESTSDKNTIQDLIVRECETYCSVYLSEDELEGLWPG